MRRIIYLYLLLLAVPAAFQNLYAQMGPGKIIRPSSTSTTLHAAYFTPTTVSSQDVLDPNKDGYVSASTAGFPVNDDVTGSEINYKPIMPYSVEPYGDLRRGPDHLYSDFVPGIDNASYYMYYRGTAGSEALLFRMRMGSIIPGAKGFSVLLDTDGKFGASGPNADPNYQAATTGTNGNPGFEVEIDLFTQTSSQTGIAVYNVDGTSSPVAPVWSATNWQDFSQIALASTSDNGDPDFFLDFFVPFSKLSSLGITASTNLRAIATTVMSPQPAIGGPKSDIYGLSDEGYSDANAEYEAFMNAQPQFSPTTLGSSGTASPTATMCTAAPVLNSPISTGTVTVSGTWTKSPLSSATSATIRIYINGVYTNKSTTVTSTGNAAAWSVSGVVVSSGQSVTAKAVAAGEGECLSSNAVVASDCNSSTIPPKVATACAASANKGITGTNYSAGLVIHVDNITRGTSENSTANTGSFSISGANWDYSGGCTKGSPMVSGTYKVYYANTLGCTSEPIYFCVSTSSGGSGNNLGGTSATPSITTPAGAAITTATKVISGTGEPNSTVALVVDGVTVQTVTATAAGAFSFSNLSLTLGQSVHITNVLTTGTINTSKCETETGVYTVACFATPPVISTNAVTGLLTIGQPITGTSREAAGSTIQVYNSGGTLLVTTTVQSSGSWTTAGATYSNGFTGTAVASTSYYATATVGSCTSANSATASTGSGITPANRCGTIVANAPAGVITSATTSVTVAYNNATNVTVTLYEDGQKVVSQSGLTGSGTTVLNVSNSLYAGNGSTSGILTIGVQESGQEEVACPATYPVSPNCTAPAAPSVSPAGTQKVSPGQTITYTIQSPTTGLFYSISDGSTGQELAPGVWAPSTTDFSMVTWPMTSATTAVVKAVSMTSSGEVCVSGATTRSVTVLPVTLLYFKGSQSGGDNLLSWQTAEEINASHFEVERSSDAVHFAIIGTMPVQGTRTAYSYTDRQPPSGPLYYRLRMVDVDGKFTFSRVVALRGNTTAVEVQELRPNPFSTEVWLTLQVPARQDVTLVLTDGAGRVVRREQRVLPAGRNTLHLTQLEGLKGGVYVLRVQTPEYNYSGKLLKMDQP